MQSKPQIFLRKALTKICIISILEMHEMHKCGHWLYQSKDGFKAWYVNYYEIDKYLKSKKAWFIWVLHYKWNEQVDSTLEALIQIMITMMGNPNGFPNNF